MDRGVNRPTTPLLLALDAVHIVHGDDSEQFHLCAIAVVWSSMISHSLIRDESEQIGKPFVVRKGFR
jgi:hypothetical protein